MQFTQGSLLDWENAPVTVRYEEDGRQIGEGVFSDLAPGTAATLTAPASGEARAGEQIVILPPPELPTSYAGYAVFFPLDEPVCCHVVALRRDQRSLPAAVGRRLPCDGAAHGRPGGGDDDGHAVRAARRRHLHRVRGLRGDHSQHAGSRVASRCCHERRRARAVRPRAGRLPAGRDQRLRRHAAAGDSPADGDALAGKSRLDRRDRLSRSASTSGGPAGR